MIDVNISISGILMCCDESICDLNLNRGYTLEKCFLDTLFFKDKIINFKGQLNTDYFGSRIIEEDQVSFICLKKEDVVQIEGPSFSETPIYLTENSFCGYEDKFDQYMRSEMEYLNEQINLLRLFNSGNVGCLDVFFRYSYDYLGVLNHTYDTVSHNKSRNTIADDCFTLNEAEIIECKQWLDDYSNAPYALLKNCIDEFSWGFEQIDIPTRFEQYTTVLEMILLQKNQRGKKQKLANRISAMLGNTPREIQELHRKVQDFYKFRSESLHEGDGSNITNSDLLELENITREILKNCLIRCKNEYNLDSCVTWDTIKDLIMSDLIVKVNSLKNSNVLPV